MAHRSQKVAQLLFLGEQRIEIGSEIITPEAERLFAMIVRLSVPLGRITSRQTMLETIWPGVDEILARHSLRQTVYKARELGLVVESGEDGLRLDPRHYACDWDQPTGAFAGEWLINYTPDFSDAMCSWITAQRVGVHAMVRPHVMRLMQTARSAGDLLIADRFAQQLLAIDTLNEEATLIRAELLAMQGSKVDALRLLDAYLVEIGRSEGGRDAALPAQLLRRRIAEKLPTVSYQGATKHHSSIIGRERELKRLTGGLFDARAGRGGGVLLHGIDGAGKTRLLFEVKKSAVLQGMLVVELSCASNPSAMPFAVLRMLVARVLDCPGACGIAEEAMLELRRWLSSREFAPDDCPLTEIEDLFEAVAEETPLLLLLEHAERIDAESLSRIDRIYRRGVVRHHMLVVTTRSRSTPADAPVELQWIERISLRPMTIIEVRSIVTAYAAEEQRRATSDQIALAAVFAEGVPMFGIEMLGLMLDEGSPDVIPWRVQVAVDRASRELSTVQLRILSLAGLMGASARQTIVADVLNEDATVFATALDELEFMGFVVCEDAVLRVSGLMKDEAEKKLKRNVVRGDALRAAERVMARWEEVQESADFYSVATLFVVAKHDREAADFIAREIGALVRIDAANVIVFELTRVKERSGAVKLGGLIGAVCDQILEGSDSRIRSARQMDIEVYGLSMPVVSNAKVETEYEPVSRKILQALLQAARDPKHSPNRRLADAVEALVIADNAENMEAVEPAYASIRAVRNAPGISKLELARAEMIYCAITGDGLGAMSLAELLATEARKSSDIQVACQALRNSAEVFHELRSTDRALNLLLESRDIAKRLNYPSQVAWADLKLASISLDEMDVDGADEYIKSASTIAEKNAIRSTTMLAEIDWTECWSCILRGDFSSARKASRAFAKRTRSSDPGTLQINLQSLKIATFQGPVTGEIEKARTAVKSAIGRKKFDPNETVRLAALRLLSETNACFPDTLQFISEQENRILASGRRWWPFAASNRSSPSIPL
jgi:AAA ATPase domain